MKRNIRREILRKRDELSPDVRAAKDHLIEDKLLSLAEFREAKTILLYASFRSEVGTLGLIRESLQVGKRTVLPRVDKEKHVLELYEIEDISELTNGYMGIPEPYRSADRLLCIDDVDLVIVPGAAFDASGNRLGYGAGYYDILLSNRKRNTTVIALAYEEQIVDFIPAEKHDIRANVIVTDQRVINAP